MTTINKEEIQKFSKIADEWWDANGKFKPLHVFNPVRIKYIKEKCISHFNLKQNGDKPLSSLKILDIGCGGGLISEPMCRLGAQVTGMDASSRNITVAQIHAEKNNLKILKSKLYQLKLEEMSDQLNQKNSNKKDLPFPRIF